MDSCWSNTSGPQPSALLQRQPRLGPGAHAAPQRVDLLEPELAQRPRRAPAAIAAPAIGNQGPRGELGELLSPAGKLRQRNVHRIGDTPAFVLLGLAQIENQRVLAIDQLCRLSG